MYSAKIHDYICDYIEDTMDPETRHSFESMMKGNELLQAFVQKSFIGSPCRPEICRVSTFKKPDKTTGTPRKNNSKREKNDHVYHVDFPDRCFFMGTLQLSTA